VLAIVRPPGESFARALSSSPPAHPIDPGRARRQHRDYRRALGELGAEVVELAVDEDHPDGCFVDDCAVVVGGEGLLTRPGAPTRRAEPDALAPVLTRLVGSPDRVQAPATLDGGDVLRVAGRLIVGRSSRTNGAGIEQLSAWAGGRGLEVAAITVPERDLHLQSVVTALGDDVIVGHDQVIGHAAFSAVPHRLAVAPEEPEACNVLAIGRSVIVPGGCERTAAAIAALGYEVRELDLSEFHKADAGATCLALLV
jgi:dimethylargininase